MEVIYPAIARWMQEQGHSYNSLGRFLNVAPSTVYRVLTGMQEPRKKFIDKLLSATGMKYEKAFGR